jgi:hypothetical protein
MAKIKLNLFPVQLAIQLSKSFVFPRRAVTVEAEGFMSHSPKLVNIFFEKSF